MATLAPARSPDIAPDRRMSSVALITLLMGAFLSIADFFIVNVALPTIQSDLDASAGMLELVVGGYAIPYALLLVLGGRLGDTFGRRRLFLAGVALFTVTSLLCGLAPNIELLVAARVAQGATAALMVPQVLATIQASTTGEHRARGIALYGATAGLAAAVGQLVGGVLVSADIGGMSWRPIFLINVPIGVVGFVLALRHVPSTRSPQRSTFDLVGTALLGVALLAVMIPMTEGHTLGWPTWAWVLLILSAPVGVAFFLVERRIERSGRVPLVPPTITALPSMRHGLLLGVPFFAGFSAFMFTYAVALQESIGMSAQDAGLGLMPLGVAFLIASVTGPRLINRYGRNVITSGAITQAIGLVALALTLISYWPDLTPLDLAPAMVLLGFGQGYLMTPLFRVVLSEVPTERAGIGSGVLVTTQQVALALGVATLGTLFLSASPHLGARDAFLVVLAVQLAIALGIAGGSRRLPDPRLR